MSCKKEDSTIRVRRRKTVIGRRQELRRIKERVHSLLSSQASQEENQYRQLQTSNMVKVSFTAVSSSTSDVIPITTAHAQTDGDDLPQTEISTSNYNYIAYHEAVTEDREESCMSLQSEYFHDGMNNENDGNDAYKLKVKQTILEWVVECNVPRCHVTTEEAKRLSSFWSKESLQALLLSMDSRQVPVPDTLNILFNIDGLPLSNSSSSEFWPILFKVQGLEDVLIAGIYHGNKKPEDVNIFLRDFCDDIAKLKENGMHFLGKLIRISLWGLSSDSPATTFALCIKSHNAYFGCRKCTTKGCWVQNTVRHHSEPKTGGRVTCPELDAPLRTDFSFRQRLQPEHHDKNGRKSILENVLKDAVNDVVIDYMHLVCIGVHKKQLEEWICGTLDKSKLPKQVIQAMSSYRVGLIPYIPSDFVRKPRPMEDLPRWKATELRLDLLYICPTYKQFMSENRCGHLMLHMWLSNFL
ncbi:hypothetical protein GHT06_008784 [Daphnia sinensis]|uniref:Transposase domain-containing protein n=1 Tax=Daphnia sinensis TaxID=1820382 RepID=A0AAD5L1W5_9CRUS|nr:hypothetical protein GHT06_008784 [Daphnia sinensis]